MVDVAKEGVTSIYNLADETREYRGEMNKLSSAATSNGYTTEYAKQKYMDLYSVLADETASNTTVSNFMAMQMSQENLNTVLHAATGIWARPTPASPPAAKRATRVSPAQTAQRATPARPARRAQRAHRVRRARRVRLVRRARKAHRARPARRGPRARRR